MERSTHRRPTVLALLAVALLVGVAHADDVRVAVSARDGQVRVDLRAESVFDDGVDRSLRSGLPARVGLAVELWRDGTLWDDLVLEHRSEHRVLFDLLDERYDVIDDLGEVVLSTTSADSVARWLQRIEGLPLCAVEELDDERDHYVAVTIRLEPLTVAEVRDLERWLRGNLHAGGDRNLLERVSGQLLGVLKGRVGLGNRDVTGRSRDFRRTDLEGG